MLMPLLVRLTDSEIEVIDGVVPQILDRIEDGFCVPKEISPCWLSIDEEALLPDVHVNPIHWNVQPGSKL
jgi:cell division septation protein DedD